MKNLMFKMRRIDPDSEDADLALELSPGQTQRRLEKQLRRDKEKSIRRMQMTTTELETKIAQVRKNLDSNKAKLEQLRIERGQLAIENSKVNAATIKRLDSQIDSVRKDVENGPVELRILQENLTAEQKRLAQEQRDELLNQQKAAARKSEKLSKELVTALEKAVSINDQLLAVNDRYTALQKQTGQNVMSMNVTQGSFGFLKVVYDYCKAELAGERPARPMLPPPYQRV